MLHNAHMMDYYQHLDNIRKFLIELNNQGE
jgi:hypothetical protein